MTTLNTDWDRLVAAFRDATMVDTYYLNTRTGKLLYHNPRKLGAARAQKVEERVFEEEDWIEIPYVESDEEFAAMEAFASSGAAGEAREALRSAITSDKPFRRFREALRQAPGAAAAWEEERLRAALDRLVDFCEALEIEIDHPAFAALRSAARGEATLAPASSLSIGRGAPPAPKAPRPPRMGAGPRVSGPRGR